MTAMTRDGVTTILFTNREAYSWCVMSQQVHRRENCPYSDHVLDQKFFYELVNLVNSGRCRFENYYDNDHEVKFG